MPGVNVGGGLQELEQQRQAGRLLRPVSGAAAGRGTLSRISQNSLALRAGASGGSAGPQMMDSSATQSCTISLSSWSRSSAWATTVKPLTATG